MKHKNNITDENYEEVVLRRAINICWVLLAICFVVKIFGGNFFDIVCNNEKFVEFCSYVDNHLWCKFLIGSITSSFTSLLFYLAMCRTKKYSLKYILFIIFECIFFVALKLQCQELNFLYNIVQCFIIPLFLPRGKKAIVVNWFVRYLIYGNILNIGFQAISLFVKSVPVTLAISKSYFVLSILSIDVIIMLALYYLYSNITSNKINKRRTKMSWFLEWLFGKTEGQLRNMKATRLAKIEKLQEEVKAIDEEINKKNESKD